MTALADRENDKCQFKSHFRFLQFGFCFYIIQFVLFFLISIFVRVATKWEKLTWHCGYVKRTFSFKYWKNQIAMVLCHWKWNVMYTEYVCNNRSCDGEWTGEIRSATNNSNSRIVNNVCNVIKPFWIIYRGVVEIYWWGGRCFLLSRIHIEFHFLFHL